MKYLGSDPGYCASYIGRLYKPGIFRGCFTAAAVFGIAAAVNCMAFVLRVNPMNIGGGHPWGLFAAAPIIVWLVKRFEAAEGTALGLPSQTNPIRALIFGITRTLEVLFIVDVPKELFKGNIHQDFFGWLLAAKIILALNMMWWIVITEPPSILRRESERNSTAIS